MFKVLKLEVDSALNLYVTDFREYQPKLCKQFFSASKDKTSLAQPTFHLTTYRKKCLEAIMPLGCSRGIW